MAKKIKEILKYFDKEDCDSYNLYRPKKDYLCLYEGFEIDLIIYLTEESNGHWQLSTPEDDICIINGKAKEGYEFTVYKTERVT